MSPTALQHRAQECRCCRRVSTFCHRGSWPHAPQLLRGTPSQVSGEWWHMSACQAIMSCTMRKWTHEMMLLCSLQRLPKKGTTPQACCISVVTAGMQFQDSVLQLGWSINQSQKLLLCRPLPASRPQQTHYNNLQRLCSCTDIQACPSLLQLHSCAR